MRFGQAVVIVDGETNKEMFLGDEVQRVKIDSALSGANLLVAAVADKKIKVLAVFLIASAEVNVIFKSDTTAISGTIPLTTNSGFVLPSPLIQEHHWMETAVGKALNLTLSDAISVGGCMLYYVQ